MLSCVSVIFPNGVIVIVNALNYDSAANLFDCVYVCVRLCQFLGSMTTQRVKDRCIALLHNWSEVLEYEPKIKEAYDMLRRQGIVKHDPVTYERVNEFSHFMNNTVVQQCCTHLVLMCRVSVVF